MARQRRGGFRPPELRGTLGTLLRTTLEQAGAVRDALGRGARSRLDEARAQRRRRDALAELGELVLDLIRRGEIDLTELPEAHDLVRQLDDLDADDPDDPDDRIAQPPTRRRFDARARDAEPARDDFRDHDDRDHFHSRDHLHDDFRERDDRDDVRNRDRDDLRERDRSPFRERARSPFRERDVARAADHDRDRSGDSDGTVSALRGGDSARIRDDRSAGTRDDRSAGTRDDRSAGPRDDRSAGPRDDRSAGTRSSGSASSSRWSPPKPSAPQRVWRPSLVDDEPSDEPRGPGAHGRHDERSASPRGAHDERSSSPRSAHDERSSSPRSAHDERSSSSARDSRRDARPSHDAPEPRDARPSDDSSPVRVPTHDPHRKGGIQFDDDEDLAEYMHPDDVPPKPPSDDEP